jgi:S1-C subfamily serine protease
MHYMKRNVFFTLCFLLAGAALTSVTATGPEQEPAVRAVAKVLPAVVNINTERIVRQYVTDPYDIFFRRYAVGDHKVHNLGSGLLISPEGYIVTNHHVVQMSERSKIRVTLSDGSAYDAQFVSHDPDHDIALIKISDKKPFPYLSLETLSPNLLGQTVIALGNPVGYQNSVSMGILSAKNRTFSADGITMEGLIQTDAAINPGNSGGPLVDIDGNLVGINSAKFAGMAIEGIGFAIPAQTVAEWANDAIAIAKGLKAPPRPVSLLEVLRRKFGMALQNLTPELADDMGYHINGGLIVTDVEPKSPAAAAGIQRGMLIVAMESHPLLSERSLPRDILRIKPGQEVRFTVVTVQVRGNIIRQRGGTVALQAR